MTAPVHVRFPTLGVEPRSPDTSALPGRRPLTGTEADEFTQTAVDVLRLLGDGHTLEKAARILNIRLPQASSALSMMHERIFGAPLGKGYARVRIQFLRLLAYAYSREILTASPVAPVVLGDLPGQILRLVVKGRSSEEIEEILGRGEAEVRAGTRRLRVAAGMSPNESWNKIVAWGHRTGNLTSTASGPADPPPSAPRITVGEGVPR
ncbi:hypothetical protein ACGFYY_05285 [Streptomyces sp. NPDC048331]|uniref:hypothetical protein n=1 Tax=Streptomyces sp. NPDC048331 TaxID=3365534 RepID=UPI00372453AA